MANSIAAVQSYLLQILDETFKVGSKTAILDNPLVERIEGLPGTVRVPKMSFGKGLADYNKSSGYVSSDTNFEYESFDLKKDRGIKLTLDSVDNLNSAGVVLARMVSEYTRLHIVPELDAYRFSTYAGKAPSANVVAATLTSATILAAVDAGILALDDAEVPEEGRIMFMSNSAYSLFREAFESNTKRKYGELSIDNNVVSYNGMQVIKVPQNRFSTVTTLTAGGGFAHTGGVNINFMIMHKDAAVQPINREASKLITPDVNQTADGYMFMTRLYHDATVFDNKVNGIYVNKAVAETT